jgi:hypothetical protein
MTVRIRSPQATQGAKLPGLQALRLQDPQAQKAFEGLREWVETRLGSRGDPFEKAVTLREFEKTAKPLFDLLNKLGDFNGQAETLRSAPVATLPTDVRVGSFVSLENGDLYWGSPTNAWKKVTLT